MRIHTAIRVLAALVPAAPLSAQSVLTGTVRADSTGRPLAGVEVVLVGSEQKVITDNSGRFVFHLVPAGRRQLLFRSVGYRAVQEWVVVGASDTTWANQMLVPMTVELAPIEVTARPSVPRGLGAEGFEERRARNLGVFFDSTEIRRFENHRIPDFLRRVPGMARRAAPDGTPCPMTIYIDGIYSGGGAAPTGNQNRTQANLAGDLMMSQVSAIEVYRGAAEVPVEYGGTFGACGVILVWTRRP